MYIDILYVHTYMFTYTYIYIYIYIYEGEVLHHIGEEELRAQVL